MTSEAQRAWHLAHREEKRAYDAARNAARRGARADESRAYYLAHREEVQARSRAYHAARSAEINARRRANRVHTNEIKRAYVAANPERSREWGRADYRRHPDAYKQRARTVGLNGEEVRVAALPPELRPLAELIRETRREIRNRQRGITA